MKSGRWGGGGLRPALTLNSTAIVRVLFGTGTGTGTGTSTDALPLRFPPPPGYMPVAAAVDASVDSFVSSVQVLHGTSSAGSVNSADGAGSECWACVLCGLVTDCWGEAGGAGANGGRPAERVCRVCATPVYTGALRDRLDAIRLFPFHHTAATTLAAAAGGTAEGNGAEGEGGGSGRGVMPGSVAGSVAGSIPALPVPPSAAVGSGSGVVAARDLACRRQVMARVEAGLERMRPRGLALAGGGRPGWACGLCTYWNRTEPLCCEMCNNVKGT